MNVEAINLLDELRNKRKTPKKMDYFYDVLESVYNPEKEPAFKKYGKKLIGTYCVLVPEELIYAADAIPVRLCGGSNESSLVVEEHFPAGSCSLTKSSFGAFKSDEFPWINQVEALVTPATCDWKKKFSDLDIDKPIHMMNVPFSKKRDSANKAWLEEIYELKRFIENTTRKKITTKNLEKAIEHVQEAHLQFRKLYDIRKIRPSVISGTDALIALNAYFFAEAGEWSKAMLELTDELKQRIKEEESICRKKTPRILVTGSPVIFPNMKIVTLIEESGGNVAIDDLCSSTRYIYDAVAMDEQNMFDMMKAVADRYLLPCMCPIFTPSDDRITRIKDLIKEFDIDGVIYHVLVGCHLFDFEFPKMMNELSEMNVPILRLETDYSPEDVEQMRTRIEAFIETLREKRR